MAKKTTPSATFSQKETKYFRRQCSYMFKVWWELLQRLCYKFTAESHGEKFLNTTVLWPIYRTIYINWHPKLRNGGFYWSRFYCHALADSN